MSEQVKTIDEFFEKANQLKQENVDEIDIFIFTYNAFRRVRDSNTLKVEDWSHNDKILYGFPYEIYSTVDECVIRVLQIEEQGKKAALICE